MQTQAILFLISFVLLVLILILLFLGCSCILAPAPKTTEGFSNGPRIRVAEGGEAPAATHEDPPATPEDNHGPIELSQAETELFDDLRNNRLSSKQINDMVKAKVLTTDVVEKFMKKLEQNYQGETILDPMKKKHSGPSDEDGDEGVEGFCAWGTPGAPY